MKGFIGLVCTITSFPWGGTGLPAGRGVKLMPYLSSDQFRWGKFGSTMARALACELLVVKIISLLGKN